MATLSRSDHVWRYHFGATTLVVFERRAVGLLWSGIDESGRSFQFPERFRTSHGKIVHAEIANLKRLYKAEGFSEAEIHSIIPDRPSKTKKPEAA